MDTSQIELVSSNVHTLFSLTLPEHGFVSLNASTPTTKTTQTTGVTNAQINVKSVTILSSALLVWRIIIFILADVLSPALLSQLLLMPILIGFVERLSNVLLVTSPSIQQNPALEIAPVVSIKTPRYKLAIHV